MNASIVICNKEGCAKAAVWAPVFRIHALGYTRGDGTLEVDGGLAVCDEHRKDPLWKQFFSEEKNPEGNRQFKEACFAQGLSEPDLEDIDVQWREL